MDFKNSDFIPPFCWISQQKIGPLFLVPRTPGSNFSSGSPLSTQPPNSSNLSLSLPFNAAVSLSLVLCKHSPRKSTSNSTIFPLFATNARPDYLFIIHLVFSKINWLPISEVSWERRRLISEFWSKQYDWNSENQFFGVKKKQFGLLGYKFGVKKRRIWTFSGTWDLVTIVLCICTWPELISWSISVAPPITNRSIGSSPFPLSAYDSNDLAIFSFHRSPLGPKNNFIFHSLCLATVVRASRGKGGGSVPFL